MTFIISYLSFAIYFSINFLYMPTQNLPLVSWNNGATMIAVFAIVCVLLVSVVLFLVLKGERKSKNP